MSDALAVNREHKDTVFRMIYKEKKELLTLYNALNGTDYQNPEELAVTTLENAIYFGMKKGDPALELKVRLLNINQGSNPELMKKCRTLREYSEFVVRVRKCVKEEASLVDAVERAVTECIRDGILEDFLRSQRSEVVAMSILEYDREEELKKLRDAEYENGKTDGKAEGRAEGKAEDLLLILEFRWRVPGWLKERIFQEADVFCLENWMKAAMSAGTLEDFLEKAGLAEN